MNYKMTGRFIGQIVALEAVFMIPALVIAAICREAAAFQGFLAAIGAILLFSGILLLICRGAHGFVVGQRFLKIPFHVRHLLI